MKELWKALTNFALPKLNGWHGITALCLIGAAVGQLVAEQKSKEDEYHEFLLEQKTQEGGSKES